MDRYWYHILLKGSSETRWQNRGSAEGSLPGITLGKTISEVSGSVKIFGVTMNSDRRLTNFYILGFVMLTVVFVSLVFARPNRAPLGTVQCPRLCDHAAASAT